MPGGYEICRPQSPTDIYSFLTFPSPPSVSCNLHLHRWSPFNKQHSMTNPGVGFEYPPTEVSWLQRDVLLFANSIGATADELHFLYVNTIISRSLTERSSILSLQCSPPTLSFFVRSGLRRRSVNNPQLSRKPPRRSSTFTPTSRPFPFRASPSLMRVVSSMGNVKCSSSSLFPPPLQDADSKFGRKSSVCGIRASRAA